MLAEQSALHELLAADFAPSYWAPDGGNAEFAMRTSLAQYSDEARIKDIPLQIVAQMLRALISS